MRWLIGVAVAGLALAAAVQAASADELVRAEPGPDAMLAEAPHQVLLTFDRPLAALAGAHDVAIYDESGKRVDDGHAGLSTYSPRTLIAPIKGKIEGPLDVSYRVLIAAGERGSAQRLTGGYRFTIDPSATAGESGQGAQAAGESKSSQGVVLWTVAILIGIAFAGAMAFFLRVATGTSRSSLEPVNRTVFKD